MPVKIEGEVSPGFEPVKSAFSSLWQNIEVGASLCVYHQGEKVVDLWGGFTDRARSIPWQADTLVNVYSATKGAAAFAFATLVGEGKVSYSDKVISYWPEFGAEGKQDITIAQLLSHQAGLCGLDLKLSVSDLYDWEKMTNLIAAQKPHWPPGQGAGYHAVTWGYFPGELIRRITGQTLGQYFHEKIARVLDADVFIGLPESEFQRCASLIGPNHSQSSKEPSASHNREPSAARNKEPSAARNKKPSASLNKEPSASLNKEPSAARNKEPSASHNREPSAARNKEPSASLNEKPSASRNEKPKTAAPLKLYQLSLMNPPISPFKDACSEAWRKAEIAASNGHASARGLAKIYAAMAGGGELNGSRVCQSEALDAANLIEVDSDIDQVLGSVIRRSRGFILNTDGSYGPNLKAFGHAGAGGSMAFADPDARLSFAYVMNQMQSDASISRSQSLVDQLYSCIKTK